MERKKRKRFSTRDKKKTKAKHVNLGKKTNYPFVLLLFARRYWGQRGAVGQQQQVDIPRFFHINKPSNILRNSVITQGI